MSIVDSTLRCHDTLVGNHWVRVLQSHCSS